jgi:hypothetical protein
MTEEIFADFNLKSSSNFVRRSCVMVFIIPPSYYCRPFNETSLKGFRAELDVILRLLLYAVHNTYCVFKLYAQCEIKKVIPA